MGMKKDKDITNVELASTDEAEDYEIGKYNALIQPSLDPMRPLLPKPSSPWSKRLWCLLAANITKRHEFDGPTWKEMEKAFYDRLKRLNNLLKSKARAINSPTSNRVLGSHSCSDSPFSIKHVCTVVQHS